MNTSISNIYGEKLDVIIDGSFESQNILIYVHGFGTDKDEGFASFLELSDFLVQDFLNVRFDLTGYGKSGGKSNEFTIHKATSDLDSVIRYLRANFPSKKLYLIAHSLGTFVTLLTSPWGIEKTVFTSIPNSNMEFLISQLKQRILLKKGILDENDITIYPRTSGAVQLIGRDFWKVLKNFNPVSEINDFKRATKLRIYKPMQDDVVADVYFDEYKMISNIEYLEVKGNHNFTDQVDRNNLFKSIREFLLS